MCVCGGGCRVLPLRSENCLINFLQAQKTLFAKVHGRSGVKLGPKTESCLLFSHTWVTQVHCWGGKVMSWAQFLEVASLLILMPAEGGQGMARH